MKKYIWLLLLLSPLYSFSQSDWFPVGAKWHYSVSGQDQLFIYVDTYSLLEVIGDTILQGKNASQLKFRDNVNYPIHEYFGFDSIFYLYEENKKVFLYHPYSETFNLLYDLNANAGDSWKVKNMCDSATAPDRWKDSLVINVDSVSYLDINGNMLKVLHIELNNVYFEPLVERIGLFGTPFWEELGGCSGFIAEGVPYGLRCYEDSIIGYYQSDPNIPCDTIIYTYFGIDEPQQFPLNIYPNPATEYIILDYAHWSSSFSLKIYRISGQIIYETKDPLPQKKISTAHFPPGIYFLELINENGKYIRKFIKQ